MAKYFLGIQIAKSPRGMFLNQHKFISDIIQDLKLQDARVPTSLLAMDWSAEDSNSPLMEDPGQFRRLIEMLMYLNFTRPNLTFVVHHLSQFMQHPTMHYWSAALHIVKYLKGCSIHGSLYPADSSLHLTTYCDADWAKCTITRRSVIGYAIMLGESLISWKCKKQNTISGSSAESKYRSAAMVVCALKWLGYILQVLQQPPQQPITLHYDNKSAISMIENPIPSKEQLADAFTKILTAPVFSALLFKMGFYANPPS
ncbi:transmembrane signal receptor [Lithospermum erythrorhizon]|uniref:Transmembrane signal receptor n=1 Tax=Lithospermum erythrorhizon TaxID=34254 RepID=A0AAV3REX6_LITER